MIVYRMQAPAPMPLRNTLSLLLQSKVGQSNQFKFKNLLDANPFEWDVESTKFKTDMDWNIKRAKNCQFCFWKGGKTWWNLADN